jgi:hypothetical protein
VNESRDNPPGIKASRLARERIQFRAGRQAALGIQRSPDGDSRNATSHDRRSPFVTESNRRSVARAISRAGNGWSVVIRRAINFDCGHDTLLK